MKKRGWTEKDIREAMKTKGIPATGKNGPATRYVHPRTGKSIVIDNKTNEIFHVGGEGFKYDYQIYVKILNEDLIVYRPVLANSVRENTFKIIDEQNFLDDFDSELEFAFGDILKCKKIDNCYYAFKKIKNKE